MCGSALYRIVSGSMDCVDTCPMTVEEADVPCMQLVS